MGTLYARLALVAVILFQFSVTVFAGPLDDYYLQQFGEANNARLQKAILSVSADTQESAHCGMPLKKGLRRDWDLLESSTQKVLAKQLAAPTLSASLTSSGGHFTIHYDTSGTNAPDIIKINQYTGLGLTSPADWATQVGNAFESAYSFYQGQGYHPPPNIPYDVYLTSLVSLGEYGETQDIQRVSSPGYLFASSSLIKIDKDFTNGIFNPLTYSPLKSLQITSAHEFHHAIQYGYNFYFDIWYAEATSTWMEDELYDGVNQLYSYLSASMRNTNRSLDIPATTTTGGGYGRWLINRHFSESHPGQNVIRSFWENLSTKSPSGGQDIPMSPIIDAVLQAAGSSLGDDFLGYASKMYTRSWTTHQSEILLIPYVSMLSTSSIYPITLSSAPTPTITLPHYSFVFFQLLPPAVAPTTLNITLTRDTGISAVAYRKTNNVISSFTPNLGTNLIVIPGFDTASEVSLLIANTTNSDNLLAGFSTDGSHIQYALTGTTITSATSSATPPSITLTWVSVDGATSYQILRSSTSSTSLIPYQTTSSTSYTDTNVIKDNTYYYSIIPIKAVGLIGPASQVNTVAVSTTESTTSSSSGGGCFIATAAYGSYLHPQVQLLRNFRDQYLLTNAPGRAFVTLYYRCSPPLADLIARHPLLRGAARLALTPLVVAVAHPLISAVALLLVIGALLRSQLRRRRAIRSNTHPYVIRTI